MKRWRAVLIALDQLANTLIGGWPDETVSARAWRSREKPRWNRAMRVINALFFDPEHCRMAHILELERRQSPPETRQPW